MTVLILNFSSPIVQADDDLYPGVPPSGHMEFQVTIQGDSVGVDRFEFRRMGDTLVVERRIRIDVTFLLFYEYHYRHKSREIWHDGRLVELTARTRDGDEIHRVTLDRQQGSLVIERGAGSGTVPEQVLPTSWWHPGILSATQLFDTQKGQLLQVRVRPLDQNPWPRYNPMARSYHRVDGDVELILGHNQDRELVGLSFQRRGYTIRYRRLSIPK